MPLTPQEIVATLREAQAQGVPQAVNAYRRGGAYCATGVLLKKAVPGVYLGRVAFMPGTFGAPAWEAIGLSEYEFGSIRDMNDLHRLSFGQIADRLESYFAREACTV